MRETLDCFFLPAEFLIFNTLVKSLSIVIRIIFVHLYIYRYIFNFFLQNYIIYTTHNTICNLQYRHKYELY